MCRLLPPQDVLMIRIGAFVNFCMESPKVNSGPILSVEAPKPAVSFPVCSESAQPIDEIQTRSQTLGLPSAPSISWSIGWVALSIPMCSKVLIFAWPCMLDCPARI